MLSHDFDRWWSNYQGRVFLINVLCQMEAGVLDRADAKTLLDIAAQTITTDIDVFWKAVDKLRLDTSSPFEAFFMGQMESTSAGSRFIRICSFDRLLLHLNYTANPELHDVRAEFQRCLAEARSLAAHGISAAVATELSRLEVEFQGFLESIVTASPPTLPAGATADLPWLSARLISTVKLGASPSHTPVFVTTDSADHRESSIFALRVGAADRARDLLGLAFFSNDMRYGGLDVLAAVSFDPSATGSSVVARRPTVADRTCANRFKGFHGEAGTMTSTWGRAVDLSSLAGGRPHRGGRETVIPEILVDRVNFSFLGFNRLPRGDLIGSTLSDEQFLQACMRGRSMSEIRDLVCR